MSDITLNITENNSTVTVQESEETQISVTTTSNASEIAFTPQGSLTSTNVQEALAELSELEYSQASAPTGSIREGALWYDTDDEQFYVRANDEWKEVVLGQYSGDLYGGSYS